MRQEKRNKSFTLIELLVVIAIIGLLASTVFASLGSARAKARDAVRLSDMKNIQTALELYYADNGRYPDSDFDGCGGWDAGTSNYILLNGRGMNTYFGGGPVPVDKTATGNCAGYRYYRYSAGSSGCDVSRGAFFVLGATDMESTGNPHPQSPGWSCPNRNWQGEFDWVTGKFEN